jgi:phosphate-selective porin OprO/OprP
VRAVRPGLATTALFLLGGLARAEDGGKFGPGIRYRNKAAEFEIALNGYAQIDYIDFLNWSSHDPDQPLASPDWNPTRLRLGVEGEWHRLSWQLQGDFGDVANFREDVNVQRLRDAWLNYRFAKSLQLQAGHFKLPVGLEWLTSARRLDFVLRSLPARNLAPDRDWGVEVHGDIGKRVEYMAGVFAGDEYRSFRRTGTTGAGRLVLRPAAGLELGGSFAQGDVAAEEEAPGVATRPLGQQGEASSGFEFFHRKYVNGSRRWIGGDLAFLRGPIGIKGEYLEQREERRGQGPTFEDLPAVKGRGWAASATWLVTGEKKKRTVRPERPLLHGPGAVELGFRYDEIRYDDVGPDDGFAGVGNRSRNLRPAAERCLTGGISWWPRAVLRIEGNLVQERFEDALLAPEPGRQGNYLTVLVRFQIELP